MATKKAAVPASKAKIGGIYAVLHSTGLARFEVDRVTIHRDRDDGSPHDYTSEITGRFILPAGINGETRTEKATIKPTALLGFYDEYNYLKAQKEIEDKAKAETARQAKEDALELRKLFYQVTGLPEPISTTEWRQPFRVAGYGDDTPDIDRTAVKPLLDALRKLTSNNTVKPELVKEG